MNLRQRVVRPQIDFLKKEAAVSKPADVKTAREEFSKQPYKPSLVMEKSVDEEAKELNLNPLVIEFMDADLAVDKNAILARLRPVITDEMIDIMAMSLDLVINKGDVYDRFNDLRNCLSTMEKYETTRLR